MCDQTHLLGLCETDFVHSIELSPALGEVDAFLVLQFIVSKVDEGEILEVETIIREREEKGGEGRGGEGRGGEGRRGEGRGGVNKCLWESGHR